MHVSGRKLGVAAVLVIAAAVLAPAGSSAAASRLHPQINVAIAFRAPVGAMGGIESPYVGCSNPNVVPRVRWVLTNTGTGHSHAYRWRGAYPGMYFPRVPVGHYKSKTTAWCHTASSTRRQSLSVTEKTLNSTISRTEFRRIHRGMSRTRVETIVGYGGRNAGSYAGRTMRTYDMMAFWRWAMITYRHGHVVAKAWDVDHD